MYSPVSGAVLSAGAGQALQATFTPTDTTDYTTTTTTVSITVNKATPTVTWAIPAAITYGTTLSATQLNATGSVSGTLVYSPVSGAVLTRRRPGVAGHLHADRHNRLHDGDGHCVHHCQQGNADDHLGTPAAITYGTALSAPN